MSGQTSVASSDLPMSASLSEIGVLSFSDQDIEKKGEDASTTLTGSFSFEQGLLLSFLAPLLQSNGQPVVDEEGTPQLAATQGSQKSSRISLQTNTQTAFLLPVPPTAKREGQALQDTPVQSGSQFAAQSSAQNQPEQFSLVAVDSVALMINEELTSLTYEGEGADEAFLSKPLSPISSSEGDSPTPLTTQDKGPQLDSLAAALSGKATAKVATSTAGTAERGMIVRRYAAFGGSTEQTPTSVSSLVPEPLNVNEQSSTPVLALRTQEPNVVDTPEVESASPLSNLELWRPPSPGGTLKGHELTGHTKSAASQPEVDSLVRKAEKSMPTVQAEPVIAGFLSRGKNRELARDRVLSSSGAEVFPANILESNSVASSQARPGGAPYANNFELWRQVVDQVGDGLITSIQQDNREARLQLTPPELGKLDIHLVVESGHIHARIVAESADVGALIQSHLTELKQALQTHRLDLDTVRVEVQTSGGEPNTFSQHSQHEENAHGYGSSSPFFLEASEPEPIRHPSTLSGHGGRISVWA